MGKTLNFHSTLYCLSEDSFSDQKLRMPWYVLYTKPRNEKKTAQKLAEKGITVYCPVQEVIRQWSDRKKKIIEPVFRSYIFVRLEDYKKEQTAVLETAGAVRFLWWAGAPGVVREEEIKAIQDFLQHYRGAHFTTDIQPGDVVVVTDGPLKTKKGRLVKIQGNKAILYLESLGWKITAEVPVPLIQKEALSSKI